ncbi:phosphoribosyltransferase family protein [Streptomyces sp. NBC_00638]|uniref:phosphoribosyltransferase n=1 Tax=unclassified Streptomyces TaxID=2593676 RepID=UPI0022551A0E|nr:phosphoribosyltransferase family protein [Streptomyces sp. NBC_00638]MCX5008338.1 phosphoribosyltransferase family protein [Streptomyces sp. NBC_00638]
MSRTQVAEQPGVAGEQPGMWSRQGAYLLDWASFGQLTDDIADAVRAEGFAPDAVLAVARGGLTAAGYLTCALDAPVMHTVRVRRTADDSRYAAKQQPVVEASAGLALKPGDKILVVDDIVGTGATADVVLAFLAEQGIAGDDVRFAAVVRNHLSAYVPDFCPAVIDDWIVFPWETTRESLDKCRPFPSGLRVRT